MKSIWLSICLCLGTIIPLTSQVYIHINNPATMSPCQDFPVEVEIINDGHTTLNDLDIMLSHSTGYEYLAGSLDHEQINLSAANDTSLSFALDQLEACESIRFVVTFRHECTDERVEETLRAQVADPRGLLSSNVSMVTLYDIDLSLIDLTLYFDTLDNTFKKRYRLFNTGQIAFDWLRLFVSSEDDLDILSSNFGRLSSNGDTLELQSADFSQIGNYNDFFEPGEFIEIIQAINVDACIDAFELNHRVEIRCNHHTCAYDLNSNGDLHVLIGTPRLIIQSQPGALATPCDTGVINMRLINFTTFGDFDLGMSLYDLVLNTGWSIIQGNRRTEPRRDACLEIFEASIEGYNIGITRSGFSGYGLRFDRLSTDPDGVGGLDDLDGDGYFDDIRPMDTVYIQLKYKLNASCLNLSCSGVVFGSRWFRVDSDYNDYCSEPLERNQYIGAHNYQWSQQYGSTINLDPVYTDLQEDTLRIRLNRSTTGFLKECEEDSAVITITLPRVVEVRPGEIIIVNGDTVDYTRSGNRIIIHTDSNRFLIDIPILIHCDPNTGSGGVQTACTFCYGSGLPKYRIRVDVDYFCKTGCYNPIPFYCYRSPAFSAVCDGGGAGVVSEGKFVIDDMDMIRETYGYTDSTQSTPVDPQSDSLNLDDLMTFDTFRIEIPFDIRCDADYDQILFRLVQSPIYKGAVPNRDTFHVFDFFADTLKIYNGETNTWSSCTNVLGPQFFNRQNNGFIYRYIKQFTMDGLFGSCLNGSPTTVDSLVLVVKGRVNDVVTRNAQRLTLWSNLSYVQDGCSQNQTKTLQFNVFSGIPSGGSAFLYQDYVQDSLFQRFYPELSVCGTFTFESTIDNYYTLVADAEPFPNEFRKPYWLDRVKFVIPPFFTFDPTSSLYIEDFYNSFTRVITSDTSSLSAQVTDSAGYTLVTYSGFHDDKNFKAIRHRFAFDLTPECYGFARDTIRVIKSFRYQTQSKDSTYHKSLSISQFYPYFVSGVAPDFGNTSVQFLKDSAKVWEFDLYSYTHGYQPPSYFTYKNVWLSLQNSSGHILIDSLIEMVDSTLSIKHIPQVHPGNRLVYTLDTLWTDRRFKLYTRFDRCEPDTIWVRTGTSCDEYPDFSNNSDDYCSEWIDHQRLTYYPEAARLDAVFTDQPDSILLEPCDTFQYEIKVSNNGLGHAFNNEIHVFSPAGLTLISARLMRDGQPDINLAIPGKSSSEGAMYWTLDSLFSDAGLPGFYLVDENTYTLHLAFIGDCLLEDGAVLGVKAKYRTICGHDEWSDKISTRPLEFAKTPSTQDSLYHIDLTFHSEGDCNDAFDVTVRLISLSDETEIDGQKLYFSFRKELSFLNDEVIPIHNAILGDIDLFEFAGWESLEVPLQRGISKGDSIKFTMSLEKTCLAPCKTTDFQIKLNVPIEVTCSTSGSGTCEQLQTTQNWSFDSIVMSPQLTISNQDISSERIPGGNEIVKLEYELYNASSFSASANYIIRVYFDADQNGLLSASDILIGRDSVDGGLIQGFDRQWISAEIEVPGNYSCHLIAVVHLDDNPCLCIGDTLALLPASVKPVAKYYDVCYDQDIDIGFESIAGYNYSWVHDGSLSNIDRAQATYHFNGSINKGEYQWDTLFLNVEKGSADCAVTDTVYMRMYRVQAFLEQLDFILCHGDSSATLSASAMGPYDQWTYNWRQQGDTSAIISNLPTGWYHVQVADPYGCWDLDSIWISEPPPLADSLFITSDFNGYDVSCFGADDGSVRVLANGGTPGYEYAWNQNQIGNADLDGLSAGWISVKVIDDNGCYIIDSILLNQPPPLEIDGWTDPAGCDSLHGGGVACNVFGGVPGYTYLWSSGHSGAEINGISSDWYDVTVVDENDCVIDTSLFVDQLPDPDIYVNIIDTIIEYGKSVELKASSNAINGTYQWMPNEHISCDTCDRVSVSPKDEQWYSVQVTDENGCTAETQIRIRVKVVKDVYAPNAFTPNDDFVNDGFTIYGNPSLEEIEELRLFDRFGELVFVKYNFAPNDPSLGWDGYFRGELFRPDVFVYWARVRFVDGETRLLSGSATLIR